MDTIGTQARRRAVAVLGALALAATLWTVAAATQAPTAGATTTTSAFSSAPGCNGWNTYTVPQGIISASVSLTGGGGGGGGIDAGDDYAGNGGSGAIVTTTLTGLTGGSKVSLTIGCGGGGGLEYDGGNGGGFGGWSSYGTGGRGGARSGGGGGGGATALCVGDGGCASVLAVAAGGGGGGGAWRACCGSPRGGHGGIGGAIGGNGAGGGGGSNAGENGDGGGGGTQAGVGGGGAGKNGAGGGAAGSGTNGGGGGWTGNCAGGGGGGGGYRGGGGGGGACSGAREAGGAGGGGSSYSTSGSGTHGALGSGSTVCGRTNNVCGTRNEPGRGGYGGQDNQHGHAGEAGIASISWTYSLAPTGSGATLNATKGVALPITLAASDPDGDNPVTCVDVSTPSKGTLTGSGCSRSYTAEAGQYDGDSFTYRVRDSQGVHSPTYTIALAIQNRTPTAEPRSVTVAPGSSTAITLLGSDPDGDPTTCAPTTPSGGSLSGGTGCTRTFTAPTTLGTYTFSFTRSDARATSSSATVTVTVASPDVAITKAHAGTFNAGTQHDYTIGVANVGNAATSGTITVVDPLPAGMTLASTTTGSSGFTCTADGTATTVTCTRTAALAPSASASFTIRVLVAEGASSVTNTATVSATPDASSANDSASDPTTVNRRPVAVPVAVETARAVPVAVTLGGSDPEGGALTYQVGTPSSGTVGGTAPDLTFTPAAGSEPVVTLTYTVTDPLGHTSFVQTVTITVAHPGVHGRVTRDDDGAPIAGVTVRLYQDGVGYTAHAATTDGDGAYDIGTGFGAGTYRVVFTDPTQAFVTEWWGDSVTRGGSTSVTLDPADETDLSAALVRGGTVDVSITNAERLTVALYDRNPAGASAYRSVANVEGGVVFPGLPAGTYYVSVTDPTGALLPKWSGNQTVRAAAGGLTVTPASVTPASFTLNRPNTISGTVTDVLGRVEGVTVQAYDATTGAYARAGATDADGEYAIRNVPAGSYKLVFRDSSGAHPVVWHGGADVMGSAAIVTMPAQGAVTVDGQLARTATLSGVVTGGAEGTTPLAGARVTLYRGTAAVRSVTTGVDGSWTAGGLVAGGYTVLFSAPGHRAEYNLDRPRRADADVVALAEGADVELEATLAPS